MRVCTTHVAKVILVIILFVFCLGMNISPAKAKNTKIKETLIKVAFVFKFLDYIDHKWEKDDSVSFCFFGFSDKDFSFLEENVAETSYQNIKLVKIDSVESSNKCQIIYFDRSYEDNYKAVLKHIELQPIITASDAKYFTDNDGIIEFYNYRDKVRFFINNKAALERNIKFNAKLLELGGRRYD